MTHYRKPTAADIGKTVELSNDGEDWFPSGELESIHHYGTHSRYWGTLRNGSHARIPVTTAADELLVAADMLEECQHNLAAEVLKIAGSMDEESLRRLLRYKQGDTIIAICQTSSK